MVTKQIMMVLSRKETRIVKGSSEILSLFIFVSRGNSYVLFMSYEMSNWNTLSGEGQVSTSSIGCDGAQLNS